MAKQTEQLNADITKQQAAMEGLNTQIAAKEKQLQTAQGEHDVLTRELKELLTRRAALEQQLHDMALLKEQLATLKAEERTARRCSAARTGTLNGERKGAQVLMDGVRPATKLPTPASNHASSALVVELNRDGTVRLATPPAGTRKTE